MYRLLRATVLVSLVIAFIGLAGTLLTSPSADSRGVTKSVSAGPKAAAGAHHPDGASVPAEAPVVFETTAYCQAGITRSGVDTHSGIAAADPNELPVGSVVQVDTRTPGYSGIYTILDTGGKVRGRILDLFLHSCDEALQFGRQTAHVKVLRRGWNPRSTRPRASQP